MRLIGVDGCRAGWVVAACRLSENGSLPLAAPRFEIVWTFAELLASLAGHQALVGVDIPIGLPGGRPRDDGRRLADRAAREFLGGRRAASVFSAPCRPTVDAPDYVAACDSELAARGKKLSRQAFGIVPKIREVDQAISPHHQLPPGESAAVLVREVHPEVTFALLCGHGKPGYGLVTSKRDRAGEAERLALLRPFVGDFTPAAVRADLIQTHRAARFALPRARGLPGWSGGGGDSSAGPLVGRDDIVDAVACLVTAYRIATGQARTLPHDAVQTDERGLRMEIVA